MKKLILTAALSASFLPACLAGPIDGVVKDKKTGETLIGSVVQVKGRQDNMTTTGLDGTFTLKDLPDQGAVTIIVNYIGYKPKRQRLLIIYGYQPRLEWSARCFLHRHAPCTCLALPRL